MKKLIVPALITGILMGFIGILLAHYSALPLRGQVDEHSLRMAKGLTVYFAFGGSLLLVGCSFCLGRLRST